MEKKEELSSFNPNIPKSDSPQNDQLHHLRTPFDLVDDHQQNSSGNENPPKLIPPNVWDMRIQLVDPETGEPIKKEDLLKYIPDVDLEEAYPGTRKTNPELYSEPFVADYRKMYPDKLTMRSEETLGEAIAREIEEHRGISEGVLKSGISGVYKGGRRSLSGSYDGDAFNLSSPYLTTEKMVTSQNIAMCGLAHVIDKWFFYRNHQFHDVHHKRRKAYFDEFTLMLLRYGWVQYKETLHKKKYHIFDKTPRAKAERLALKRTREKTNPTLMIS